jgi:hypothetical protein
VICYYTDGIERVNPVETPPTHEEIDLVNGDKPSPRVAMHPIQINQNIPAVQINQSEKSVVNMHFTPSPTRGVRVQHTICFVT